MRAQFQISGLIVAAAASVLAQQASAASVYLLPAYQEVPPPQNVGPFDLPLWMDFTGDPTLGGGVDLWLSTLPGTISFVPSAYFLAGQAIDPTLWGFGIEHVGLDHDYQIHFASFNGLSGLHELGTVIVNVNQPIPDLLSEVVKLSINNWYGDFYSSSPPYGIQAVTLTGTAIIFNPVPEPHTYALMLVGLCALGSRVLRRGHAPL